MALSASDESRLVDLEMQLMHLQNDYDQINAVCLTQQGEIENQRKRIERLEDLVRGLLDRSSSSPSESVGFE